MQEKETKKTLIFILVAGMALLVAWEPWRPAPLDTSAPAEVGQKVFPDFTDPLAAKSLEIVTFNEDNASMRDFRVAQTNGVWSIPSHSDYPADAKQHMADAATALMDLKILNVASDRPGDRKEYGVITPDPKELRVGMTGVGTRVTVKNGKDKVLADLVIGKQVKDQVAQHYVRRADRDQIYTVNIKTDQLSTKFDDWIEKDLLKLNAFDVREVELNDYSSKVGVSQQGKPYLDKDDRNIIKLSYDDSAGKWKLEELTEFDEKREPKPAKLADDEELNTQRLNDLKSALDDLQIVDVERKPVGLSQDLRASEEFLNNSEAMQSLADRGFLPVPVRPGGPREIFSTDGEATCTTKDGVRYVLRFGNLSGTSTPEQPSGDSEKPKSAAPNRYLFVMVQFDESQIPKPKLKPVPGAAAQEKSEQPESDKKPAVKPADKPAVKPAVKPADKPAEKPADKPADKPVAKPADKPAEKPADKPAAKPAEKPAKPSVPETKTADLQDAAEAPGDQKPAPADKPKAEKSPKAPQADDKKQPETKEPAKPATAAELEKLAVERENKRLQDEYNDAVKRGQEKVKELNDRFADWYFIISDDVFQKIHLGLNDVVKKKEAKKPDSLDALDKLEEGVKIGPGAKDAPQ
jgi:Domain of unknown function (DUF4340)